MARYDFIAVYMMASGRNGTLYLGVTSDLLQRGLEHCEGRIEGFSAKYGCKILASWESCGDMRAAIAREKQIKKWRRAWKLDLIEKANPQWRDLYEDLLLPQHLRRYDDPWHQDRAPSSRDRRAIPGTQGQTLCCTQQRLFDPTR